MYNGKKLTKYSKMSLSEVTAIQVLFHLSGYKTFKNFTYVMFRTPY